MKNQILGGWGLILSSALFAMPLNASVVQTDADGTTFDVTDGVLTINVPAGVTNQSYDYVANILNQSGYGVTSVVKEGTGILKARAASNYTGKWTVKAGVVDCGVADCLGSTTGPVSEASGVTVMSGASLAMTAKVTVLKNKKLSLAGSGAGGDYKGALFFPDAVAGYSFQNVFITLSETARIWDKAGFYPTGGQIDLKGHTLELGGDAWENVYFCSDIVLTNSDDMVAATVEAPCSSSYKTHLKSCKWVGGSHNVLNATGKGRLYIEGKNEADWTLSLKGSLRGDRSVAPQTARANYYWSGPVRINGTAWVGNDDGNSRPSEGNWGYGLAFKGKVSGDSSAKFYVQFGSWVSFEGTENDYQGDFKLDGNNTSTVVRCAAYFQKDAPFLTLPSKTVEISNADIWMDAETVRAISSLSITKGRSTITGSAVGSTIPAITVTGGATNVLETPAAIAAYNLTAGRLVLGTTTPTITTLTASNGEVVDLGGRDYSVASLVGIPKIEHGGILTVGSWSYDITGEAPLFDPSIQLVEGEGKVTVSNAGEAFGAGVYEVLYYLPADAAGVDPARFVCSVANGLTVSYSTQAVTVGPHAGQQVVVATVAPTTPPASTSYTCPDDGTTFVATDQVLTITVPDGVTCTYDYASLVAANYITNIVKAGTGSLQACGLSSYVGGFDIASGKMLISVVGALGKPNAGVVYVRAGGALQVENPPGNGLVTYKTIYLEGTGPDGLGALVGASSSAAQRIPFQYCTFILTGDAQVCVRAGGQLYQTDNFWDFAGSHRLTYVSTGAWAQLGYFQRCVCTNSVPGAVGRVCVGTVSGGSSPKFQLDGPSTWIGGSENIIDLLSGTRTYLGRTEGDWTLRLNGGALWAANSATTPADATANFFKGPIELNTDGAFGLNESYATGTWTKVSYPYPFSVYGPIRGAANRTLTINTALHLFSPVHEFEGTVVVNGTMNTNRMNAVFRNGVYLHDNAVFPGGAGKSINVTDADLWLADTKAFALPVLRHVGGVMTVSGGARGDSSVGRASIAGLEKTSALDLTVDSSAMVTGTTAITTGTLTLADAGETRTAAEMPVFSNLVFSSGTALKMNGHALEVPNFTGLPAIVDAGALTIDESLAIDGTDAKTNGVLTTTGALSFGAEATLNVSNIKFLDRKSETVVARAEGGVSFAEGVEELAFKPECKGWHATVSSDGKALMLSYQPFGTMLIFR